MLCVGVRWCWFVLCWYVDGRLCVYGCIVCCVMCVVCDVVLCYVAGYVLLCSCYIMLWCGMIRGTFGVCVGVCGRVVLWFVVM